MTPADIPVEWPTCHEIARAVFVASALEGFDPIDVIQGFGSVRARAYAFIALAHEFPTAPRIALGRKLGKEATSVGARSALVGLGWAWFDLERLNAVRAACGWSDMAMDQVRDAPLIYCGRSYTEFLPRKSDDGLPFCAVSDLPLPVACSGGEKEPAPIQSSDGRADGRALKGPTGSLREESLDTGSSDDRNERGEGSVTPRIEAGQVRKPAPSISQGRAATRTEDLDRVVAEPVVEPGPSDVESRALRVERMKAFAGGDPPKVAEVEAPPRDAPAPKPASTAASALAGAALAIQANKTPPEVAQKPTRAAYEPVSSSLEIADVRRPVDPYRAFRAAEAGSGVTSFHPDAPAHIRGVQVIPVAGEPPPGRSALDQRNGVSK